MRLNRLRTFALIVGAQRYCAGNATVMSRITSSNSEVEVKTFAKTVDDKTCTALDQRRS